ncbi:hypothetical protein OAK83_02330 [bacterium]|nr:hypothetical protein [bacterium]
MTIRRHSECMLATACSLKGLPLPPIRIDGRAVHHDCLRLVPALGAATVPFQDRIIRQGLDQYPL